MKAISQMTRNTKNRIFAMPTAVPAIPPKPRIAAIIAITRNTKDQCNIFLSPTRLSATESPNVSLAVASKMT